MTPNEIEKAVHELEQGQKVRFRLGELAPFPSYVSLDPERPPVAVIVQTGRGLKLTIEPGAKEQPLGSPPGTHKWHDAANPPQAE